MVKLTQAIENISENLKDSVLEVKYIVTHSGAVHRDDFLSVCIALNISRTSEGKYPSVLRREPTIEELNDPNIMVLDVGGQYDPSKLCFDHHQLERDSEPTCALSMLNEYFNLGLEVYSWYNFTVMMDSKGPIATANCLGCTKEIIQTTISPIEEVLQSIFKEFNSMTSSPGLFVIMVEIGRSILSYSKKINFQVQELTNHGQIAYLDNNRLIALVTDIKDIEPKAMALWREMVYKEKEMCEVAVSISPDDRGDGWSLYRFDDHPAIDFAVLQDSPMIKFAHKGGFIAKTNKISLQQAIELAKLGLKI